VLVTEKLYDRDYVVRYTSGFEQLEKHVRDLTPEWAAPLTDIPAERIRETARAMGAAKPAVLVHPGRHTTWYGDDVQRGRAMAILTALLGAYGRKGGMFLPTSIKTGGFPTPKFPVAARGRADGAGGRFPLAGEEEGVTNGMVDATLSGKPYPIKAWITYAQNVLGSIPQPSRTVEAIMKLDLMVVVDVLPVEQTRYADLVLPEATYLERYDPPMVVATAKEPFISVRMPAIEPLHDSRPGWWIARELARRLDLLAWFPWETPEQHLAKLVEPTGVNLAELVATGAVAFPGKPYLEDRPSDERVFPSPSGKIELWSKQLADLGADPLPRYTAHEQPPTGFVRLLYGRAAVHSFGRTQNNEPLHALMPENAVWLSTATARAWGVADGQRIMLENSDGVRSDPVLAKVTEGIRSDCAFMAHGFGAHAPGLRLANRRGTSDNALISRVSVDPLTGATGMRVNFVRPVRA
jgi:thiosulfate reductase/polysulfide reductase chain A